MSSEAYIRDDNLCAVLPVADFEEMGTYKDAPLAIKWDIDRIEIAHFDDEDGAVWIGIVFNKEHPHYARLLVDAEQLKRAVDIALHNPVPLIIGREDYIDGNEDYE